MTLDKLIEQNDGKPVEVAGSANAKFQCVDLSNLYIRDVLGLPIIEWTDAKDFPERAGDAYNFIKNTPEAIIERGDIPVWSGSVGYGHGHIAVCIQDGDINSFVSFDQNWSTPLRCKIEAHTYQYIRGWLRKKGENMYESEDLKECLRQHSKLVDECIAKGLKIKELEKEFELANKKIDKLIEANGILENKAETDLAKAKLDYEKLLADEKIAFKGELERVEEQHRLDLIDLEQKYKDVDLPEPEPKLKTFKQKLAKALEILFS